ncbi:hypothetical protein BB559_004860 [Furculomyces boomerangus]|uniref:Kinesin motor domain-containing protein n=2 Tax=Furculomyces boomerangus TaxID=61424 RepID=A0A2T9YC55_9FUNG|nr:hypothetical protein BB559_004860 [Furculomyces boomerangus]
MIGKSSSNNGSLKRNLVPDSSSHELSKYQRTSSQASRFNNNIPYSQNSITNNSFIPLIRRNFSSDSVSSISSDTSNSSFTTGDVYQDSTSYHANGRLVPNVTRDSFFKNPSNISKPTKNFTKQRIVSNKTTYENPSSIPPVRNIPKDPKLKSIFTIPTKNRVELAGMSQAKPPTKVSTIKSNANIIQKTTQHIETLPNPAKSVFSGILSGVNNLFSPKKDSLPINIREKEFSATPKTRNIPFYGKNDVMQIPVSKTPFTNRKTIAEYNSVQDPIETFLILKPSIPSTTNQENDDYNENFPSKKSNKHNYEFDFKVISQTEIEVLKKASDGNSKREKYLFAGVMSENTQRNILYKKTAGTVVENFLKGKNSLVFAYGVTGSGKTFTMQGNHQNPGLILRAVSDIVTKVNKLNDKNIKASKSKPAIVFEDGYSLRPKLATQVEWCMDPRVVDPKLCPVPDEEKWIKSIENSLNISLTNKSKEDSYKGQDILQSENISDEEDSDSETDFGSAIIGGNSTDWRYSLYLSYFEVYNEMVLDLLDLDILTTDPSKIPTTISKSSSGYKSLKNKSKKHQKAKAKKLTEQDIESYIQSSGNERRPLMLRSEGGKGAHTFVEGLTEVRISSIYDAIRILIHAQIKRKVHSTGLNHTSSRSHALCSLKLVKWRSVPDLVPQGPIPDSANVSVSTLLLVDLAGAERAKFTNNTGERLVESNKINVSLMTLRKCMDVLRYNSELPKDQSQIVPFNESKLTRLFQPALEGGSKTVMLACVDPSQISDNKNTIGRTESINVLEFAHVASTIVLSNKVNRKMTPASQFLPSFMSPTKAKGRSLFDSVTGDRLNQLKNSSRSIISNESNKSTTKSARNSLSSNKQPIKKEEPRNIMVGVKRTADVEIQTEEYVTDLFNQKTPTSNKRQKINAKGNWKAINVNNIFSEVKKEPTRRRSFPNISDFTKTIENKESIKKPDNSFNSAIGNNSNSSLFVNDSTYSTSRAPVFLRHAKMQNEKEKSELSSLRLAVQKQEARIAQIRSEKEAETSSLALYTKELQKSLNEAEKQISEANRRAFMVEVETRQSLSKFYLSQIEGIHSTFMRKLRENHEWADDKTSEKIDLLLECFTDNVPALLSKPQPSSNGKIAETSLAPRTGGKTRGKVSRTEIESGVDVDKLHSELEKTKSMISQIENKNQEILKERNLLKGQLEALKKASESATINATPLPLVQESIGTIESNKLPEMEHLAPGVTKVSDSVKKNAQEIINNAFNEGFDVDKSFGLLGDLVNRDIQPVQDVAFTQVPHVQNVTTEKVPSKLPEEANHKKKGVLEKFLSSFSPEGKFNNKKKDKLSKNDKIQKPSTLKRNVPKNSSSESVQLTADQTSTISTVITDKNTFNPNSALSLSYQTSVNVGRKSLAASFVENTNREIENLMNSGFNSNSSDKIRGKLNELPSLQQETRFGSHPGIPSNSKPKYRTKRSSSLVISPITSKNTPMHPLSGQLLYTQKSNQPFDSKSNGVANGYNPSFRFSPEANLVLNPNVPPSFPKTNRSSQNIKNGEKLTFKTSIESKNTNYVQTNGMLSTKPSTDINNFNNSFSKGTKIAYDELHDYNSSYDVPLRTPTKSSNAYKQKQHGRRNSSPPSGSTMRTVSSTMQAIYGVDSTDINVFSPVSRSSSLKKNNTTLPKDQYTKKGSINATPPLNKPVVSITRISNGHYNSSSNFGVLLPSPNGNTAIRKGESPKVVLPTVSVEISGFKRTSITTNGSNKHRAATPLSPVETMPGSLPSEVTQFSPKLNGSTLTNNSSVEVVLNGKNKGTKKDEKSSKEKIASKGAKAGLEKALSTQPSTQTMGSSLLSSIFNFTSGSTISAKNNENGTGITKHFSDSTIKVTETPVKKVEPTVKDKRHGGRGRKSKEKKKEEKKNEGFMLSPFKIFYKLRSRK